MGRGSGFSSLRSHPCVCPVCQLLPSFSDGASWGLAVEALGRFGGTMGEPQCPQPWAGRLGVLSVLLSDLLWQMGC